MAKIAIDESEIAWAAGLFDGEGTIFSSSSKNRPRYVKLTMAVVMTNKEAVDRFANAVDIGFVTEISRRTITGKTVWRWTIQGTEDVKLAFNKLRPYLCTDKINQGDRALSAREEYERNVEKTTRTRCSNGHSFPENRAEWPNGKGYCIECRKARTARAKERELCVLS